MGAGASTASNSMVLEKNLASREEPGVRLGAEFEVMLLKPKLEGVPARVPLVLRVAYESLVVCRLQTSAKDGKEGLVPIAYFKYQDIICWGSTSALFQFKMFGSVLGRESHVAVIFQTVHGRTIEKVTLESVHALMADMEKVAVTKAAFDGLKVLLGGPKPTPPPMATAAAAAGEGAEAEPSPEAVAAAATAAAAATTAATAEAAVAADPTNAGAKAFHEAAAATATAAAAAAAAAAEADAAASGKDSDAADAAQAEAESEAQWAVVVGVEVAGAEQFTRTVTQFAASRGYTIHQAVQLMDLAIRNESMDAFDRMDFALALWTQVINRDSFQLVVNMFGDPSDRENLIARVKATQVDRKSSALLRPDAATSGGGIADSHQKVLAIG